MIDRLLYFDWKYVLGDNDLRKVGEMCALGGIEVSYPMLDDALVDFSLRVPNAMKIRGQELRHFYKRAMQGFLPDGIINKPKHGFGLPFGVWLKTSQPLQDYVGSLFDGLKSRKIFATEFLTHLLREHREGEPGYYGSIIWDVLMLEAWLQAHDEKI